MHPQGERSPQLSRTVSSTVSRPRRRLRWSAHGSGDCPTTAWHLVSSGMAKVPPDDRTDSS
eukprot:6915853-Prymnesium_polylepis.1